MKITATFTGKNYLGYETGNEYTLSIVDYATLHITRADGSGGTCPYQSLRAFLMNWNNIRVEPEASFFDEL